MGGDPCLPSPHPKFGSIESHIPLTRTCENPHLFTESTLLHYVQTMASLAQNESRGEGEEGETKVCGNFLEVGAQNFRISFGGRRRGQGVNFLCTPCLEEVRVTPPNPHPRPKALPLVLVP